MCEACLPLGAPETLRGGNNHVCVCCQFGENCLSVILKNKSAVMSNNRDYFISAAQSPLHSFLFSHKQQSEKEVTVA